MISWLPSYINKVNLSGKAVKPALKLTSENKHPSNLFLSTDADSIPQMYWNDNLKSRH